MSGNLKPCPFCGKEACYVDDAGQAVEFSDKASCGNSDCMPYETYVEVAIWQTRPIEDELTTAIEQRDAEIARLTAIINRAYELAAEEAAAADPYQQLGAVSEALRNGLKSTGGGDDRESA